MKTRIGCIDAHAALLPYIHIGYIYIYFQLKFKIENMIRLMADALRKSVNIDFSSLFK